MSTLALKQADRIVTNGVDVTALFDTIAAIKADPALAKFNFRARNQWLDGGHNRSSVQGFYGAGRDDESRAQPFVLDADEPPVLLGRDAGANPVEYVLHALAACLTTSLVYHAAARGIAVEAVASELDGDLDVRGFLGMSDEVRRGYQAIRVRMRVKSPASITELTRLAKYSPVYEMVSRAVPVELTLDPM